ncbi:AAA family ATPase [Flavobacterium jejuense]|uniref:AAA family ATPase n=1 Tax=Flavobacterium jejuense TaxID=1544455 RepID=A0ABX0IPE4_9FLAO|nr:helix-turn-helix domain-containing protein [Flavobacterium jejuense]NHN25568.1 AAA family ATPase [Flavobacterium jejuense]
MNTLSIEAIYTLQFVNQTKKSIFLTGKAGTGKTTLLKEIINTTHKNTVVVAPTGIAALNAGGVTIHSMFQLPFATFIPDHKDITSFSSSIKIENRSSLLRHFKMNAIKRSVIRNMELLIIDEVSMLRADVLDAIDFMMRKTRKIEKPFGGVQVIFIGDLLQLPPVVKQVEWQVLRNYYSGMFFFNAQVMQQFPPLYIELSKIYRQSDTVFIELLNNLRKNKITRENIVLLNKYVEPNFNAKENKGYISLTTHNAKANEINQQSLQDLKGKLYTYLPDIVGDFPEKIFPIDEKLELKIGAQVMFIKNDLSIDKQYFNGKMGVIESLSKEEILIHFPEENKTIEVEKYEWENVRFKVNESTKEIEEEVIGTFVHYPIKLAWAITVHKSQGLTFEKAALDVSQVFAPGQAYVALSRLRSLEGLVLLSPLQMNGISSDENVLNYASNKATEDDLKNSLVIEKQYFILEYLSKGFQFKEVIQEWRNHFYSYKSEESKSIKAKHLDWVTIQYEKIIVLEIPSEKFLLQLQSIFNKEIIDNEFIKERCDAAFNYFFKPLDTIFEDLLFKIEEIKRTKNAKAYFNELIVLEELLLSVIIQLAKARIIAKLLFEEKEINKENLYSNEIKNYKSDKLELVKERFKKENSTLIDDEEHSVSYYERPKKKKTKKDKKSTIEETLELFKEHLSIPEIAKKRKLTEATIYNHFTKLIQMEVIEISEILSNDKIIALTKAFKSYENEGLAQLKEAYGEAFSWDELKLFRATLK